MHLVDSLPHYRRETAFVLPSCFPGHKVPAKKGSILKDFFSIISDPFTDWRQKYLSLKYNRFPLITNQCSGKSLYLCVRQLSYVTSLDSLQVNETSY